MKPSQQQIALINSLCVEIAWWKESNDIKSQFKLIEEFVQHELHYDLSEDQKNRLTCGLNHIMSVIQQVK